MHNTISFFRKNQHLYYGIVSSKILSSIDLDKILWLFDKVKPCPNEVIEGPFIGPPAMMVTPWSTSAVEIVHAIGISSIMRIEKFVRPSSNNYNHMLQQIYPELSQVIFDQKTTPKTAVYVANIAQHNQEEGLALNKEEINYLQNLSNQLERPLTDSEVFGFAQVNSEHCRHKIFNGTFIIDGVKKEKTLFDLIRITSQQNPNTIVSAYKDNVALIEGPTVNQFAPNHQGMADYFTIKDIETVITLKAETHNFPTTIEPFNGAATGVGGEIRDRMAGGKGSVPMAGTAVYMTSYTRIDPKKSWENHWKARPWSHQTPIDILIKASDGASDYGNKFGQPLICGSVLTFEHFEASYRYAFDKVVMLAGGVGYAKKSDSNKENLQAGQYVIMMGGDNYRIGIGGSSTSSTAGGKLDASFEQKAIQRANPEMQKRVMNVIRSMAEAEHNIIASVHDHGAGGHLNCFIELLENQGGTINIDSLPLGDESLSYKEILSNESQERMGIIVDQKNVNVIKKVAERERAPLYVVGQVGQDKKLRCHSYQENSSAVELSTDDFFKQSPKITLEDKTVVMNLKPVSYEDSQWKTYLDAVIRMESVGCKDWLINKVDRSVTGRVAMQQTCGALQIPINNLGVIAMDFASHKGIATALGHAPGVGLVNPAAGSRLAITRSLTNIVWAPLTHGLKGVALSANWMWAAQNTGEGAKLYDAVEAASLFTRELGINIPTGKDSLSMTQKYQTEKSVQSPGTVVISAIAAVEDIRNVLSPVLQDLPNSKIIYIGFDPNNFDLGGSSLGQTLNQIGGSTPRVTNACYVRQAFQALQECIYQKTLLAGHDVAAGGLIVSLLEMCFTSLNIGLCVDITSLTTSTVKALYSESPGVVVQTNQWSQTTAILQKYNVAYTLLGTPTHNNVLGIKTSEGFHSLPINKYRELWYEPSLAYDTIQRPIAYAQKRKKNYHKQPLHYTFPAPFNGKLSSHTIRKQDIKTSSIRVAIIREKGVNGDRELAYALYIAGFNVKDIHMSDISSGKESLADINLLAFPGGFSHADTLGSAKGWAGICLYNENVKKALSDFYAREDTLSIGVCNGCQLMMALKLIYPEQISHHPKMTNNGSGKFESLFANVVIPPSNAVMLQSLINTRLGVWVAHGEGRFQLPKTENDYHIAMKYAYGEYPGNPNDSDYNTAALVSSNGRHLALMPHIERSLFPWNWPYYPKNRHGDEISPWILIFNDAFQWLAKTQLISKTTIKTP